ncbi:MAG TPA: glycosyl hydrolase family 1 [Acetobacteraceae bacterium]|nr:glycosyl hydrolase family 1 [Acetobacteraceae bacterium]
MSHSIGVSAFDAALWRALAFARSLNGRSPRVAKQLRRGVLLLWWTVTLQLHVHARYWLRARRLRRIAPAATVAPILEDVDPGGLVLPLAEQPLVSLIIPTFGQVPFTLRCLASIARNSGPLPIETIVIDDAAGATELDLVRGIRLVRNDTNLGFLHSCNKAAALAKGRYLCFLNNDTQVLENWLEPMVALFRQRPDTGAVGAKLLYPDGRLQEAGGIIWQDASGWNFGRLEDPAKPAYNYVREVDYCSGAALMVQRETFAELGGFDPRYAPAYYEDTDLCFRLRRIGLKTLYQPAARVIHYEGISHGRDTTVGIKSYQVRNRRLFAEVWADELTRTHGRNGENVFRARERSQGRRVALVVDHYVPTPDRDAGSRTMISCLEILLEAGWVVKFWPHNLAYSPGYTEALQAMGIEVFHGPGHPSFEAWIKEAGKELDMVLVSRPDVAEDVIPVIRRHAAAPVIYYGHDLHFRRMGLQAAVTSDNALRRAAELMRVRECAIWRQADVSLYLSEEEAQMAAALQPGARIRAVIPYCFDQFADRRDAPTNQEIVFIAGFGHPPNEDAAVWFATDILPLIRTEVPEARLSIIGSNPTQRVRALARDGVTIDADVTDAELQAAYARARVAVVPLRCGAGVKLKVVEALRTGLPLVTTPVGAQGLPGLSEVASVCADPATFAAAVVTLARDDLEWEKRSLQQTAFARARFSRRAMRESLLAALDVRTA